jgi:hypothetical protein
LAGEIPSELGALTELWILNLSWNHLAGAVPESFINLVNLCVPGMSECSTTTYGLDLGYNRLSTPATPQALANFLLVKDPDWAETQLNKSIFLPVIQR